MICSRANITCTLCSSHLLLEKLLKANWVKDHAGDHPPRIHNLISLADKTKLKMDDDQRKFFERMNAYQLEGHYPDYQSAMNKLVTRNLAAEIISETQ